MNKEPVFSPREHTWIGVGLVVGAVIIVGVTAASADRPQTFVNAIGAIGQVGIAVGLYFLTRAQLRVAQEHLTHDVTTYRQAERRERTQARIEEETALRRLADSVGQLGGSVGGQEALGRIRAVVESLEQVHGADAGIRGDLNRIKEMAAKLADPQFTLPAADKAKKRRQLQAIANRVVASLRVSEEDAGAP